MIEASIFDNGDGLDRGNARIPRAEGDRRDHG